MSVVVPRRMLPRLLPLLACFATGGIAGVDPRMERGDLAAGLDAERRMAPAEALGHFRAALGESPDDAFIHQKIAQQLSDLAFLESDVGKEARLTQEALVHAERAVEIDPSSPVAQLSLAVLHGKTALHKGVGARVEMARQIYDRATRALELDPEYAWAHHVLGKWHVELSGMNLAKRALVSLFLGGLPKASLGEGVRHLEEAVRLEPDCVAHRVELGFAYLRAGREADARESWEGALAIPSKRVFDPVARQRAVEALAAQSIRPGESGVAAPS